jgi:hypothetical protein
MDGTIPGDVLCLCASFTISDIVGTVKLHVILEFKSRSYLHADRSCLQVLASRFVLYTTYSMHVYPYLQFSNLD